MTTSQKNIDQVFEELLPDLPPEFKELGSRI